VADTRLDLPDPVKDDNILVYYKRKWSGQFDFEEDNYEKSFVSLLVYSGDYNLPEVLIPFCVKAKVVSWSKILILFFKLKNWIKKTKNNRV